MVKKVARTLKYDLYDVLAFFQQKLMASLHTFDFRTLKS